MRDERTPAGFDAPARADEENLPSPASHPSSLISHPVCLYTVGHSNHAMEDFLGLLTTQGIEALIDTRSNPRCQYVTHFNVAPLRQAVMAAGLRYLFLGNELGGRPDGAQYYDADGHVRYDVVAQTDTFLQAIEKVERGARKCRVALLCSEENPAHCHRRLLVGRVLAERGADILHLRGDGSVQSETEMLAEEEAARHAGGQQALFDVDEGVAWRSTQSVLRRRPRGASSAG